MSLDPPREDGRRCLDAEEMRALGWTLDKRGRWTDPESANRVRVHHSGVPLGVASDAVEATLGRGQGISPPKPRTTYDAILQAKRKQRTATP